MAENKDKFVDRTETYIASPQKEKLSKNKSTVIRTEDVTSETTSGTDGSPPKTKKRVSSTSWQITKTTEITDEVQTGQKVTTMQFDVEESGAISPGVESEKHSFLSSTEFDVTTQNNSEKVFGTVEKGSDDTHDPSDEYVFIESGDLGYVDRMEITEVHEEQESVAPEAKKSYFAYLLDQSAGSTAASKNAQKTSSNEDGADLTSSELEQKQKDDATMYERITYTPGLAIRSYAVEELKQKKTSEGSPERSGEDAENNNMEAGATAQTPGRTSSSSDTQGLISPSEGYRISQIIAVQETELWEEERLKKQRQEYSIIDSLTMDDMMKMLGEHDRMKFESQVANEDVFPIVPGLSSDGQRLETVASLKSTEQDERTDISNQVASVERKDAEKKTKRLTDSKYSVMSQKGSTDSKNNPETEIKYSETKSHTVTGPIQGTESLDNKYSQMSQRVEQIKISTSSVEQTSVQSSVTDSASVTAAVVDNRQTETAISSHDQPSRTGTQELKTQIKSSSDAEQSVSMGIRSEQSATSLDGGVTVITAEKQSVASQKPVKDEPMLQPVEVERKFNITADTEIRIKNLGGKLMKEKSFVDIYYDNSDYTLTLSDCWLRKRDNSWEMKVGADGVSIQDFTTQYKEITKVEEIIKYLKSTLQLSSKSSKLNEILKTANLSEFATISTTRKSYKLPECTIDLDLTDHGFQVGEIEVMAPSSARVPAALKTIDDVARKLDLTLLRLT